MSREFATEFTRSEPRPSAVRSARRLGVGSLAFIAVHVPLALAEQSNPTIGTLHAYAALAFGLWLAVAGRRWQRVAYAGAYLTGAEVLWRMTNAEIYWEFAKYATAVVFLVALARSGRLRRPPAIVPYFLLLLPSAALTLLRVGFGEARGALSFNLSGPFALMVSVWFLSYLRFTKVQRARCFVALLGPIVGVASVAIYGTVTASTLVFGRSSNFTTSGDFGPNQVSAILGLGVLLCLLLALDRTVVLSVRILMFGTSIVLGVQSALTFSRTGLAIAAVCIILTSFYLVRSRHARWAALFVGALLCAVLALAVLPRLDSLTSGALAERFRDTSVTGRDQLVLSDLRIWWAHPLLGVGPGQVRFYRSGAIRSGMAHTEFSRMLAEHGVLGLLSLGVLVGVAVRRFRAVQGSEAKAFCVATLAWSGLFMLVSAMRLVAPGFMFGLSAVTLVGTGDLGLGARRAGALKRKTGRAVMRVGAWRPARGA